jgi:ribosomal protein S18 acetylase RimI-like enzyme
LSWPGYEWSGRTFEYHRAQIRRALGFRREDQARAYWMQPPPNLTLVLRDAGAVVGTATLHPNHAGPGMHVANASFAVDPRCRSRGVGRQLAEDTLARARAGGYRAMQFNAVVETNEGAVALWKSMGFRVLTTSRRPA